MKYTTEEYVNSLKKDKENLSNILKNKEIEINEKETFTSLISKINTLPKEEDVVNEYVSIDLTNVKLMSSDSYGAIWKRAFKKLPAFTFNGTSCNGLFAIFSGTEIDFSNIDTSNSTDMQNMFHSCPNLTSLSLLTFNTQNVTKMGYMFTNSTKLTSVNLSNWNTTKLQSTTYMFDGCSALKSIDLSGWETPSLTTTSMMFNGCYSLSFLDIRNFDFTTITSYNKMFGSSSSQQVPATCLIIVKDNTAKNWLKSKFSYLTNVKTVAEYEG